MKRNNTRKKKKSGDKFGCLENMGGTRIYNTHTHLYIIDIIVVYIK